MAKRFTDTEKWTKNKWFRKLSKDMKLFWLFIVDNCDMVGVWEEDIEFVCGHLDLALTKEQILSSCSTQIFVMPGGKKWWIRGFCSYQYGVLKEENIKNKPHQRYISELKKHRLWIDYTKTIHSLQEKEEEKEEVIIPIKPQKDFSKPPTVQEILSVADCLHYYFGLPGYSMTREANCMRSGIDIKTLEVWAVKFNDFLIGRGTTSRTFKDWTEHFSNWLNKQDTRSGPQVTAPPPRAKDAYELLAEQQAKMKRP